MMRRILSVILVISIVISGFILIDLNGSSDMINSSDTKDDPDQNYQNPSPDDQIEYKDISRNAKNTKIDKNQNKIHDSVEDYLAQETYAPVFIGYPNPPTFNDEVRLSKLGIDVAYRCKYVNMIITGKVSMEQTLLITQLPEIVSIEPVPELRPFLDVSARSVKARGSTEYSPNTAWELGYSGEGINIVIMDTGVDDGHPSLENKFVAGADFAGVSGRITTKDGTYNPDDDIGHGTSLAGVALGTGAFDGTYSGVAPGARLIDLRVTLGRAGDIISALEWCIDHQNSDWNNNGLDEYDGIDVVSISVGGDEDSDGTGYTSQLLNRMVDAGMVVVVAAGNNGPNNQGLGAEAATDKVITVGNLDDLGTVDRDDDVIHPSSSRGPRSSDNDENPYDELKPDVVAPGTDITAPDFNIIGQNGNGYQTNSGSSLSCPHVSGICALMLEANPNLTPKEIKKILQETAEAMGEPDLPELSDKYNYAYGFGSVDAYEAVKMARNYVSTNERPEIQSLTISPKFVAPQDTATITTKAIDQDGDELTYNYNATGGSFSGTGSEVTWTAPDEIGEYEITVIVYDGIESSKPEKGIVTVETDPGNHPPVIDSIMADPVLVNPGENSTITVTASDPDADELSYDYTVTGGTISGNGAKVNWIAPNADGKYTITCTVSDGELFSGSSKVIITVEGGGDNKPPIIDSFTSSSSIVATNSIVRLYVIATDPELGNLKYTYSVDRGRITGSGANVNWTAPNTAGGNILTVTVTDNFGLTDKDELFIEVFQPNSAPEILERRVSPNSVKSDGKTEVIFTLKLYDNNGLGDIATVFIDLSTLFGEEKQRMYDDGKQGDRIRDDGIYTYSYLVPRGLSDGQKKIQVTVTDYSEETVRTNIFLNITAESDKKDDSGIFGDALPLPGFDSQAGIIALCFIILVFITRKRRIRI